MSNNVEFQKIGANFDPSDIDSYLSLLFKKHIESHDNGTEKPIIKLSADAFIKVGLNQLCDLLQVHHIFNFFSHEIMHNDDFINKYWLNDDFRSSTLINMSGNFNKPGHANVKVFSNNEKIIDTIKKFFVENEQLEEESDTSIAHVIVKSGTRYSLIPIGSAFIPIVKTNYSKRVNASIKKVIVDLNSRNPSGRIVIFEGPPGTGKTHLIRGLMPEVKNTKFIIASPEILIGMQGPELLPLLLEHHVEGSSLIFIVEDADQILVKRDSNNGNMNAIQALLNLSDGIIGSMLDIRVITTTNAKILDIEPAILRPGRLSARINVDLLSKEEAIDAYKSLVVSDMDEKIPYFENSSAKQFSLASVYEAIRANGAKYIEGK